MDLMQERIVKTNHKNDFFELLKKAKFYVDNNWYNDSIPITKDNKIFLSIETRKEYDYINFVLIKAGNFEVTFKKEIDYIHKTPEILIQELDNDIKTIIQEFNIEQYNKMAGLINAKPINIDK